MNETSEENVIETITFNTNIINYNITDAALSEIEIRLAIDNMPTDLSKKENYDIVKNAVSETRKLRGKVDTKRKELKKPAIEFGRNVEAEAKRIISRLMAVEEPIKQLKDDFNTMIEIEKRENARFEEERVDFISTRIASINALVGANVSSSSTVIKNIIESLNQESPIEWAGEFYEKAGESISTAIEKLTELFDMKTQSEKLKKEQEIAEAKREEEEKKRRVEHEKQLKQEKLRLAEENEKLAKEREIFNKEREEQELRIATEQAAKLKKEQEVKKQKEQDLRIAAEKRAAKEAVKMENKWTDEAVKQIAAVISKVKNGDNKVSAVVAAIKAGKIAHISWQK